MERKIHRFSAAAAALLLAAGLACGGGSDDFDRSDTPVFLDVEVAEGVSLIGSSNVALACNDIIEELTVTPREIGQPPGSIPPSNLTDVRLDVVLIWWENPFGETIPGVTVPQPHTFNLGETTAQIDAPESIFNLPVVPVSTKGSPPLNNTATLPSKLVAHVVVQGYMVGDRDERVEGEIDMDVFFFENASLPPGETCV